MSAEISKEIEIPSREATFWMDRWGHWCNRHGRFQHRKLIAYFHASIVRDEKGYHVTQINGGVREKVYFRYEDTALFVFGVLSGEEIVLVLNTGRRIALDPAVLFIRGDALYLRQEGELIKFSQKAMLSIGRHLTYEGGRCVLDLGGRCFVVPVEEDTPGTVNGCEARAVPVGPSGRRDPSRDTAPPEE